MLSPFFKPRYGARIRRTRPPSPVPLPPFGDVDATRPTALTIPVNIAVDPRPIMYQSPAGAAPRPPSAALRQAELPERPEKRAPHSRRARRATAPSTSGPRAPRPGVWRPARLRLHITTIGSRRAAAARTLAPGLRDGRHVRRCPRAPTRSPSALRVTRRPRWGLRAPFAPARRRG